MKSTDYAPFPIFDARIKPLKVDRRITIEDIGREPFRILFPTGVLAGIVGVALWPLYFWGAMQFYPSQTHPHIMIFGLFGAFIFGFLGTALPRMLSSQPFRPVQVFLLTGLHVAMVSAFATANLFAGDALFLTSLAFFFACVATRVKSRKDTPPPGFVLVGLAFASVIAGTILGLVGARRELDPSWTLLERLLCYQGFILLPILGIGPFLLPRFFGMPNPHDFPEALVPPRQWFKKAAIALAAGLLVIASFFVEIKGWFRVAHAIRFGAIAVYLILEMPFHRAPKSGNALGLSIRIAFACVLAGFLAVLFFPAFRVNLLHLTFIGGFAILTFVVATRVVFGHSGNAPLLKQRNRWLLLAVGVMLFAMLTRMSGDYWPKVMISHYVYGAILWIIGVLIWAWYVLPKVLVRDSED